MISIRRRLLLGTLLAVTVSSALASAAAWISVRAHLVNAAEADLGAEAGRLLGQLRRRGTDIHWAGMAGAVVAAPGSWWVVLDAGGQVRASSAAEAQALAKLPVGTATMPDGQAGRVMHAVGPIASVGGGGGGRGRWAAAETGEGERFTVVAARSDAVLESTLAAVAWALGTAVAMAAVLAGAAAWMLARSVIRPVDRLAGAIAAAKPDDQRIAVDAGEVPRELHPVVERADSFLAMARDLLQRERQTTGNIAHELRTPLAGLAAVIDLALARARDGAAYRQALERSRGIVGDTARMVEQLLLLTRLEAGREPARREAIAVDAALAEALAGVGAEATRRRIVLPEAAPTPGAPATGDRDHLLLVLRNLLGNAVAHAPEGAVVTVAVEALPDALVVRIANPAPELPAAAQPHLGEQFWRGAEGRGDTGSHAGLGLALCRRLAALNGWRLDLAIADGGFTAVCRLPTSSEAR